MAVPYTFGTATASIPLSNLDSNFATTITLGNTAIQLGNTVTTLNNMTLANVTVSSGNVTFTNVSATTANVTTANITTAVIGTATITTAGITTANVTTANITTEVVGTSTITTAAITTANVTTANVSTALSYSGTLTGGTGIVNLGSGQFYKDASGNVGIGTSSPANGRLDVVTASGSAYINVRRNSQSTGEVGLTFYGGTSSNNWTTYMPTSSNDLRFNTAGSDQVTIQSSGIFLVGTTTQIGAEQVGISFPDTSRNGLGIQVQASASGPLFIAFRNSSGTLIGSVARVTTTNAVVYNTTSDERLKSNVADADTVLDKLMAVKVRQFDWTEGDLHQDYGFIAQELKPVLSGLVTEGKTDEDMWQMDYSRLTPHLVKAIQEQQALITALTARITALETQ